MLRRAIYSVIPGWNDGWEIRSRIYDLVNHASIFKPYESQTDLNGSVLLIE